MSSISGGGVQIHFVPDMSAVNAALSALRSTPAQIPVSFVPQTPSATTFGAAASGSGAVPFTPNPLLQTWQASQSIRDLQSASSGGGANQQFAAAVQQFSAAVEQLSLSGGSGGGGGGDDDGGGGGGGSGRGGGRSRQFGGGRSRQFGRFRRMLTLGYAAYEGFRIGESFIEEGHKNAQADYEFGVGSPSNTIARARNRLETTKGIFGSSVFGLIDDSQEHAEDSLRQAEDSQNNARFAAKVYGEIRTSDASTRSIDRKTIAGSLSYGFGFVRQKKEIEADYANSVEESRAAIIAERIIAEKEPNLNQRGNLIFAAEQHERQAKARNDALARKANSDLERVEFNRSEALEELRENRSTFGRSYNLFGNEFFGIISEGEHGEAEFRKSLHHKSRVALKQGPDFAADQKKNNAIETAYHNDRIQFDISQRGLEIKATEALLAHKPLQARLAQNDRAFESEFDAAKSDDDRTSVRKKNARNISLINQEEQESIRSERFGINRDIGHLRILNNLGTSPGQRYNDAALYSIRTSVNQEATSAFNRGRDDLVPAIFRRAAEQTTQLAVRKLDSITAEEVDPRRTQLSGPNTEDLSGILQRIYDQIEGLANTSNSNIEQIRDSVLKLEQGT